MASKGFQNIVTIIFLLVAAFFFFNVIFFLTKGIYTVLGWLAPILLIAALVINHKVVLNYGKFVWHKLLTKPLIGLLYGAGTFFLFPIASALLLLAAVGSKKMNKLFDISQMQEPNTVDAEFEIVEEETTIELELPEAQIKKERDSRYEDLF